MATGARRASREVAAELHRPGPSSSLRTAARAGLASRAVIYVMLGVLAYLIVAHGRPPSQASGSGALTEIAKQPAGPFLLGLLSAGLLCYAGWRLVQAVSGIDPAVPERPSAWKRAGWLGIAVIYLALFAQALSILTGGGGSGGPANHPQGPAATILSWPAGPFLLGLLGAALAVSAVAMAVWSCVHDYRETMDVRRAPDWSLRLARVTGTAGNLTRAALLALVASYTLLAAVDDAPSKEKSLDQSLEAVMHTPAGAWWITLAATGLIAYALYSVIEVRYRRI